MMDYRRMSPDDVVTWQETLEARQDNLRELLDALDEVKKSIENRVDDGLDYGEWYDTITDLMEEVSEEQENTDENLTSVSEEVDELEHGNWGADV